MSFVKLKKSKNPIKTRNWVGGSRPTRICIFFFKNLYIFFFFFLLFSCFHVLKKNLDKDVGGWGLTNPSFSQIFWFFFNLTKPHKNKST